MPLINIMSPKGGVGTTTLCANLAEALRRLGYRVVMIDFDPQNALCLHSRFGLDDERGLVTRFEEEGDWRALLLPVADGVEMLPFGLGSVSQQRALLQALGQRSFVEPHLERLIQSRNTFVLVDMPAGQSPVTEVMRDIANLSLAVFLADPASLALLPRMNAFHGETGATQNDGRLGYVINQMDTRSRLNREVVGLMLERFGPYQWGVVHRDEALMEALAEQRSVFDLAPASAAARDIGELARRLAERFPLNFAGDGGRPF
ncbi:cellulose biosynthesis protein BcsQ [Salinicola lusitanus]|uniref:Cellulose biosynthesis protein BcsQ n=1 Tax=Salinicola lusitanus TaxID=1949085 RepID=A0ABZ3CMK0_9GAMM|nr:cellulose biosynthesis protein BcsQ [Salinicola lusitanus]